MADTTVTNTDLRDALNRSARLSSGGTDIAERSLSGWGTLDADVVDRLVRQLEDGDLPRKPAEVRNTMVARQQAREAYWRSVAR